MVVSLTFGQHLERLNVKLGTMIIVVKLGTMIIVNPDEDVYMFEHYILFQ